MDVCAYNNFDNVELGLEDVKLISQWGNSEGKRVLSYINGEKQPFIKNGNIELLNNPFHLKTIIFSFEKSLLNLILIFDSDNRETSNFIEVKEEDGKFVFAFWCMEDNGRVFHDPIMLDEVLSKVKDLFFMLICHTIMTIAFFTEYKAKEVVKVESGESKGNYNIQKTATVKKNNIVKLTNKTFKVNQNSKEINKMKVSLNEKKRERHTATWTVRGHWRTTKTGKEVWVKPHIKGAGEIEPKIYKV